MHFHLHKILQVELFTIKTFHEVVDQIYYKVSDSSTLFV